MNAENWNGVQRIEIDWQESGESARNKMVDRGEGDIIFNQILKENAENKNNRQSTSNYR